MIYINGDLQTSLDYKSLNLLHVSIFWKWSRKSAWHHPYQKMGSLNSVLLGVWFRLFVMAYGIFYKSRTKVRSGTLRRNERESSVKVGSILTSVLP